MFAHARKPKSAQSEAASARSELLSKQAMRDSSFFVASMLLLLQQMVQGQTIGSEFHGRYIVRLL